VGIARRKPPHAQRAVRAARSRAAGALLAALAAAGCNHPPTEIRITVDELESGTQPALRRVATLRVADPAGVRSRATPLCDNLGLLVIDSPDDWAALRDAVPVLGDCPDLDGGAVVGVVAGYGRRLDDRCPISIEDVRVSRGAGLVSLHFAGGTFLRDGTTWLTLVHAPGVDDVLIVDVDGARLLPHAVPAAGSAADRPDDAPIGV